MIYMVELFPWMSTLLNEKVEGVLKTSNDFDGSKASLKSGCK